MAPSLSATSEMNSRTNSAAAAPLWVLQDGSANAQTLLQRLQQLGYHVEVIQPAQLLTTEVTVVPLVVIVNETHEALLSEWWQQVSSYLRNSALLVSDSQALVQNHAHKFAYVASYHDLDDVLRLKIQLLTNQSCYRQQIVELKQALSWHKARVDREHQLVEHIFQNALSRNYLDYPHVNTYLTPVSKFNGDLCLIAPGPLGNLYMLMADFTGHGLAPATGALPLSQAFFAMSDRGVSVAEMVTEFNFRLNRLLPNDMFCAAILLELSANGERVTYWNGGMPAALVCDQAGTVLRRLDPQHMALGVLDDDDFDSRVTTFRAAPHSSIAMFTDGVIELLGHQQEFLGADALEKMLSQYPNTDRFNELVNELEHFRGETPLRDDLSLAILYCRPTGLGEVKPEPDVQSLPFKLTSELHPEQLRSIDPVSNLMAALSQLPLLRRHRTTIYLLLAEAFNNALEHGLLGLDSALKSQPEGFAQYYQQRADRLNALQHGRILVTIELQASTKQLKITVADSGDGFIAPPSEPCVRVATEQSYGRGLELLRQMTTDLQWNQAQREVSFTYSM